MKPEIKQRIEQIKAGQVPEGYKRTRAGIMPYDWCCDREYRAKDIFKSITNKKHNGEFNVLSATQDKGVIPREQVDINIKYNKDSVAGYKKVDKGDFVISLRSFQGGIEYSEYEGLVSPAYTVLKPIIPICDKYYKYYFKTSDYINRLNIGTYGIRDGKQIGYEDFGDMVIHYPPLAEQEKIAKVLSTQDRIIELYQRKIEELQKMKKIYLSKMFPKKGENVPEWRFPQFTGAWEQRKFGEVFDCTVPNNTLSRAELSYDEGTVLNVHYGDVLIKYGSVLDVQKDDIPRIPHRCREDFNGALLQDGDVIIADTAEDETTGKACEIGNLQGSAIVSGLHTMVCRPRNRMALGYLGYYLNSNAYHHQLLPLMQGIKVLSLSRSNIQKTSVSYPSAMKEQQLIASYFSQLDHLITLHQRKLEETKKYKKALMQLLLTGIVRCE